MLDREIDANSFNLVINNISQGEIKKSNIHGYGLFAKNEIFADIVLASLDGQLVPWNVYTKLIDMKKDATNEWNALTENLLLVRPFRTKYSFINHSRDPNCEIRYVMSEPDTLLIVSKRFIKMGEELTLDYRLEPLNPEYVSGHGSTYL